MMNNLMDTLDVAGLMARLDECARVVAELNLTLAAEMRRLKKLEAELADGERAFEIAWSMGNNIPPDPKTGKKNATWTSTLLAEAKASDEQLSVLRDEVHAARGDVDELQAMLAGEQAQFSAMRYKARLAAAQLVFMAGTEERIPVPAGVRSDVPF